MDAMKIMTEGMLKAEKPQFEVGDTVRVDVRIKEGERERIQAFEGTVIAKKHGGIQETFTVRRSSYGVGVERVFPINSPFVEKVTVVRRGKVRRAKLYYLRKLSGKAAKLKHVVPPNALPYPHACNSENPNNDTVVVIVRNTDVALGAVVGIFRHIHIAIH